MINTDLPIIAFDAGKGRFYFYETSTGDSGPLGYAEFVSMSWLSKYPNTKQLIIESAHLRPQKLSLAQPLTEDQLRELHAAAEFNDVKIFVVPGEQRASRSYFVHRGLKKDDDLDSEAIGKYYTSGRSTSDVKLWNPKKTVDESRKLLNREMTYQANMSRLHSGLPGYGITEADRMVDVAVRMAVDYGVPDFETELENGIRDHILSYIKGKIDEGKKLAVFSSTIARGLAITVLDQETGEPWTDDNGNEIPLRELRDIAWGDSASHGMLGVVRSDIFHWGLRVLWNNWAKDRKISATDYVVKPPRKKKKKKKNDADGQQDIGFDGYGDSEDEKKEKAAEASNQIKKLAVMQDCEEFRIFRRVFRRVMRNISGNIKKAATGEITNSDVSGWLPF